MNVLVISDQYRQQHRLYWYSTRRDENWAERLEPVLLLEQLVEVLTAAMCSAFQPVICSLDVHESVHRGMFMNTTKEMQPYRLIYYSKSALHVSGYVFVHYQEHLTVFTVSGSVHPSCCRLVSWMSWNWVLIRWWVGTEF